MEADNTSKIIETTRVGIFTHSLRDDGILEVFVSGDEEMTVEGLIESNSMASQMMNYKRTPVLITFDRFALPSLEVRQYWAKAEVAPFTKAEAFLVNYLGHKLMVDFYHKVNKPKRPTKIFTDKCEAIAWLKTFL